MKDASEQLCRLNHSLTGVRHIIFIHAVNVPAVDRFQLRHFAPRFHRVSGKPAFGPVDEIENPIGIDGQKILFTELLIAPLGGRHGYMSAGNFHHFRKEAAVGGGIKVAQSSRCAVDDEDYPRLR